MGQKTNISWTDHTFNPVWGCTKVSPGCAHCYAEALAIRRGWRGPVEIWGHKGERRTFGEKHWLEPYVWDRKAGKDGVRRRVFVGSMCDWCDDHAVTVQEVKKLWPVIMGTPNLDWLLLTKRPERIGVTLPQCVYPRVWLGTSIESGQYNWRADYIKRFPVPVRFISYEPALGPLNDLDLDGLDWIIYGGESGPGFRQDNPEWAEQMKDRCDSIPIAFFMKQRAGIRPGMNHTIEGKAVQEIPIPRLKTQQTL